jgi:drug/metabolite transporter (DMT)-like permease
MLFAGFDLEHHDLFLLSSLLALLLVAGLIYQNRKSVNWLVILGLILPFVGSIIVSFNQNIYVDRYFIFASAFFAVLIAAVIWRIPKSFARGIVVTGFTIVSLIAFHNNWRDLKTEKKTRHASGSANHKRTGKTRG